MGEMQKKSTRIRKFFLSYMYCKQNAVRNVDYDIIPVKFCIWFGMAFSGIFVTRNLSAK